MKLRKSLYNFLAFSILTAPLAVSAQWDPGSINNEANLPGGTLTQIIINIMRWLLIIVGFIAIVRWLAGSASKPVQNISGPANKTPADILRERYARGEIEREEFLQRLEDLKINDA